jgi:N-glycosylase/DNA lyase
MGFRAPFLLAAARKISDGKLDLNALHQLPIESARGELVSLIGVGRKISDCVLLFAYGRQQAFPVDVWIMKALRELYFPRRKVNLQKLQHFAATYFGPNAGYAQQYLFHYARSQMKRARQPNP